ncbi:hypothetical protein HaLaN_27059 [Haematococcus lacustris]|uniref:Uncharacterized protein n=1 Tax=Haematococcus lacustris TaxID=44745 RepID=A0A6A0A7D9_HAELA|nr:hypothetical protein HaLaN_27059 [Haematococcus lacustris]
MPIPQPPRDDGNNVLRAAVANHVFASLVQKGCQCLPACSRAEKGGAALRRNICRTASMGTSYSLDCNLAAQHCVNDMQRGHRVCPLLFAPSQKCRSSYSSATISSY